MNRELGRHSQVVIKFCITPWNNNLLPRTEWPWRVTGHSTVEVVLKHYFRPGREAFRAALGKALPKMLTGGEEEPRIDLPKAVQQLAAEARELDSEMLVKKIEALAEFIAA